ncbi:MAG: hypothetical protein A2589_00395 [Candidatus Vogelbacteria bacterium RIFOXYD1_FULL_46_19]|uniref:Hedgehog N-terminal signalling domain-containing protein n=1 Tax=Candidatus Vogelbacteria bacterium RIFOXYD1_FULL_46_19 TaxID=1802439 RepID=A0A1G2QHR0_9BACT|nr:MAG: hypothetical protein A2589_00395 [Candidatus Vogelbacteria bacterium RIFOXYD1_FULL_46_19]
MRVQLLLTRVITFTTILILVGLFLIPTMSWAQNYTLLEPTAVGLSGETQIDFSDYAKRAFDVFLGLVVLISVLMIVVGGLEYIFGAAVATKTTGQRRVYAAVGGLVLALTSWLILYTINPDLVNINFSLDRVGQSMNSGPSAPTGTSGTTRPDSQNPGTGNGNAGPGAVLSGSVPAQSDCHEASNTECVSLNEAGATVANGYSGINGPGRTDRVHRDVAEATVWVQQNLNSDHNLSTQITAAHTEGVGHSAGSEHYEGRAVDIQPTGGNVTSSNLNIIADYCRQAGFTYVLVENRHVHCDAR